MSAAASSLPLSRPSAGVPWRVLAGVFLLLFGVYALSAGGHTYSTDEEGMLASTKALADRRSPVIDFVPGLTPATADKQGRPVGVSGLAQSVVAAPLYKAGRVASRLLPGDDELVVRTFVGWTNAWVTALGALFVLLLARLLGATVGGAVAMALVYGLATFAWPHAKTFFSEPVTTTLALGGTYFTMAGVLRRQQKMLLLGGFVLGSALFGRVSAALFLLVVGVYVLARTYRRNRVLSEAVRAGVGYGVGVLVALGLLLLSNWWRYGAPLDVGYESVPFDTALNDGLYGLFLSSGKSLFLYAPITLVGLLAALRPPVGKRPEVLLLVAIGTVNALLFAKFRFWQGDHAWGPRYLIMTLPFFVLPVAARLGGRRWQRATVAAASVGLVSALLGTILYFNNYFFFVSGHPGTKKRADGGIPFYYRMYFEPYWSPVLGHARFVPDVVRNSWNGLGSDHAGMPPLDQRTQYQWYFEAPPQLDSWAYWLFPARGPKQLLAMVPVFAGSVAVGGWLLWPLRRRRDTEPDGEAPVDDNEAAERPEAQEDEGRAVRTSP